MAALTVNIHATALRLAKAAQIFGAPKNFGVLLIGKSGSGKSDLALRLIARGAELIADDRTDLLVTRGKLIAKCPRQLTGLLEVRGVGIIALSPAAKSPTSAPIGLVIRLGARPPRLPEPEFWRPPAALALKPKSFPPVISLAAFEASAPEKVLVAAAALAKGLYREEINPN
ncbi:hypothetical protein FHS83_003781 [Rhizomicrobium palustre]|uniref:HPr kinase/phosphorylase C-terminal domain-containing protein n=1 Tax=Rhizomicrobium palustre TaxID=189966 RepID=A0A846N4A7_9PROT|nr:HPr kinase/phosphatase C-terminal domain-containing protein [Rhizomicrobium palustre]NIK90463.1 hypothetical protein [Rhizomicrobium palustre]